MPPAVPDKVPCETPGAVEGEFATLQLALDKDETEHTWEQIDRAVKRFHACVRGGATKHTDTFVRGFRQKDLVVKIVRSMATERTRLSSSTLDLLASITRLGLAFAPLLPLYLPALLRLLCRTNKLYIARASSTLQSIIAHTHLPDILKFVAAEWKNESGKSASFRQGAVEAVLAMLGGDGGTGDGLTGGRDGVERRIDDLEWVIKTAATDREPKVRATAKSVWEVYKHVWPERVYACTAPMTPVSRRYLNISAGAPAGAPAPTRPPVPAVLRKEKSVPAPPVRPPSRSALSASTSALPPSHHATSSRQPSANLSKSVSHHASTSSLSSRPVTHPPPVSLPSHSAPASRSASRNDDRSAATSSTSATTSNTIANTGGFKPSIGAAALPKKAGRAPLAPPPMLPHTSSSSSLSLFSLPPPAPTLNPLSTSTSAAPTRTAAAAPKLPPARSASAMGHSSSTSSSAAAAGPFRPKPPTASTSSAAGRAPVSKAMGPPPAPATALRASKTLVSAPVAASKPTLAASVSGPKKAPHVPTASTSAQPHAPAKGAHVPPTKPYAPPRGRAPAPVLAPAPAPRPNKPRSKSPIAIRPKVDVSAATKAARERRQEKIAREEAERVKAELVPLPESDDESTHDNDEDEDAGDVAFRDGDRWAADDSEKSVGRDDSMVIIDETGVHPVMPSEPEIEEKSEVLAASVIQDEPPIVEAPPTVEPPSVVEPALQELVQPAKPASPVEPVIVGFVEQLTGTASPTPIIGIAAVELPKAPPLRAGRALVVPATPLDESSESLLMDFGGPDLRDESVYGYESSSIADESGVTVTSDARPTTTPAQRCDDYRPPSPFLTASAWEERLDYVELAVEPLEMDDIESGVERSPFVDDRAQTPTPVEALAEAEAEVESPKLTYTCDSTPTRSANHSASPTPASQTFTYPALPPSPTFSLPPSPLTTHDNEDPEPSHTCSIIMETPVKLHPAQFTLNFAGRRPAPAPRFLRDEAEDQSAYEYDEEEASTTMDFDVPLNDADVSDSFELDLEEPVPEPREVEETQGEETREVLKRSLRNRDVVVVSPVLAKTPRQAARTRSRDVLGETQGY